MRTSGRGFDSISRRGDGPLRGCRSPRHGRRPTSSACLVACLFLIGVAAVGCSSTKQPSTEPTTNASSDVTSPGVTSPSTSAPSGPTVTVTSSLGFQYKLEAGRPTFVAQFDDNGTPDVAPPGTDYIEVPVTVTNVQADRSASLDTSFGSFALAIPTSDAASFGVTNTADCSSVQPGTGASTASDLCGISRTPAEVDSNGDNISSGVIPPPLAPSSSMTLTVYFWSYVNATTQFPPTAPLNQLVLLYVHLDGHATQVPLP